MAKYKKTKVDYEEFYRQNYGTSRGVKPYSNGGTDHRSFKRDAKKVAESQKKANYAKGVAKRKKTLKKKVFRKRLRNSAIRIGVLTGGFAAADSYLNRRKRKGSGRKPKNK